MRRIVFALIGVGTLAGALAATAPVSQGCSTLNI